MEIKIDDLSSHEIKAFLEDHINDMKSFSPPGSKHALDLDSLKKPEITFWTIWDNAILIGCAALKELDQQHGEIKSMRVSKLYRGKGIASILLQHILNEAKNRQYNRLSLETGSMPFFKPARVLYEKHNFKRCLPFSNYHEDPNSVFMSLLL